jgi:hypothetical protein
MTAVKQRTIELVERLPDEQLEYVFNILRNVDRMTKSLNKKVMPVTAKQEAYQNLLKYKGILPANFDAEKELAEAKEEKYGCFD